MMARAESRLSQEQLDRVNAIIRRKGMGLYRTSRLFDVCPDSLKIAAGGLPVSSGTVAKVALKIAERDGMGKIP